MRTGLSNVDELKVRKSIDWKRLSDGFSRPVSAAELQPFRQPIPIVEFEVIKSINWSTLEAEPDGRRHVRVSTVGGTETGRCLHHVTISVTRDLDGSVHATGLGAHRGVRVADLVDSLTIPAVNCARCCALPLRGPDRIWVYRI